MRPENNAKLKKIKRVSNILRAVCKALLPLTPMAFVLALVALVANRGGTVSNFDTSFRIADLTVAQRLIWLVMQAMTSGIMFKSLWHLQRLFGNYSHGDIFTMESVGQLRQLGITCLMWGGLKILWGISEQVFWRQTMASVQVRADSVPIGIIILIVAWFMDMAVEMREENELTV